MSTKGKPFKRGRRVCIFCGGYPITREHIWPDWLKHHMPRASNVMSRHTVSYWDGTQYSIKRIVRHGTSSAGRLKVTCDRRNNGWISRIDNNVKELLLSLAAGKWGFFSRAHRVEMAAWATRFVMVYEYSFPPSVSTTTNERDYFKRTGLPPDGWRVFLGYYDGITWRDRWNQRALINLDAMGLKERAPGVTYTPNAQSTVLVLGHMALNILSGPTGESIPDYTRIFGLGVVWPDSYPTFFAPPMVLGDDAVTALASHFAQIDGPLDI
jgi:hypothetical protein